MALRVRYSVQVLVEGTVSQSKHSKYAAAREDVAQLGISGESGNA